MSKDLKRGSQFSGGKIRIYALYQHEPDRKKRAEWLKNEYGIGGRSFTLVNGESGFTDFSGKGVEISSFRSNYKKHYTWLEAEKAIERLINANQYMTDKDMEKWNALPETPYPEPCYVYPPKEDTEDD